MLFQRRFHPGLRDGSIDLTFRRWARPQVRVGGRYRLAPDGVLVVDALDQVALGAVTEREARRSGFASVDELVAMLKKGGGPRPNARTKLFRVRFHHVREAPSQPPRATRADVDELARRLERMDRLSRHGPWTRAALSLVAENPRTAASQLAPRLERDLRPFKVDVRKLKKLGLTRSFEVGYELTPLGRRVLARLDG